MIYNPKIFLGMVPLKRIYKDGELIWRRLNVLSELVIDETKISIILIDNEYTRLGVSYESASHQDAMTYLGQHTSDMYELYIGSQVQETTLPTGYSYNGLSNIWVFSGGNSLVALPSSGFLAQCTNLRKAAIPTGISVLPPGAYANNSNLTDIGGNIPGNILEIQGGALQQIGIQNLAFDSGIQTLKAGCFANSTSITEVHIPSSIQTIEQGAFYGCTGIHYIYIAADSSDVTGSNYAPWGATNATVVWNAS